MSKKKKRPPSIDQWLQEAKAEESALKEGMILVHNGIVRQTPRAQVRAGVDDGTQVKGMDFDYDQEKVEAAVAETYKMGGVFKIKVWLNQGYLNLGDDIMYVLVGGDIRPHVIEALEFLVEKIKSECVTEIEKNK
jgi:molybdopterin synthase catalytic subunit